MTEREKESELALRLCEALYHSGEIGHGPDGECCAECLRDVAALRASRDAPPTREAVAWFQAEGNTRRAVIECSCTGSCRGPFQSNENGVRCRLAALRAPASEGEACPECGPGAPGYTVVAGRDGEPEQQQCRACFERAATHPTPATVTEAMVEAGAKALVVGVNGLTEKGWENKDGDSWIEAVKAQAKKEMREVLAAALGGAR